MSDSPPIITPSLPGLDDRRLVSWMRRAIDIHAIVAITDAKGIILYVNDQFCRISGYSRAELIGQTHRLVKSDVHPREFFAQMWETINEGRVWHGMICNRAKAGQPYWVESTIVPLPGADGKPEYHLAIRTDVTRLKRAESSRAAAEARAQLSSEQLRLFFDHAPIGIFWVEWGHDGSRDVYHPNQRFCEIIGLTPAEASDYKNIREASHPEDRVRQDELVSALHSGDLNSFTMEKRYIHRGGKLVWASITIAVLRSPSGRVTHQFAMLEDITERRRAEEELRDALRRREELESIVNRSPSIAVLWRAEDGRWPVEFVSASVRQFGYSPEDFTSRRLDFQSITHPGDLARVIAEVAAHAQSDHREYNQEYRVICADGTYRWVDDHTVVRKDSYGKVTHHEGLITDITARKAAEEREREHRERDLRLAGEVQHHLRPHVFPDIGAVEIEALSQPSTHIGGDYYDVLPVDARRWGFVIADVSGKGAAAALIMAACRATLRQCAIDEPSAAAVVRRVNRALHSDMPAGRFISLFYGILDLDTNSFRYVRAGHEPALLLRPGKPAPELLSAGGLALGFDPGPIFDASLTEGEVQLNPGDLLALYTDGITEAIDSSEVEFGRERLAGVLLSAKNQPLAEVTAAVDRAVMRFAALGPRNDDRTLLLVRPRWSRTWLAGKPPEG